MREYIGMGIFTGLTVVEVPHMADRVQARKHRKRRINKKWLKRYGYRTVPWNTFYVDHQTSTVYAHPKMIQMLKLELINGGDTDAW